MNAEPKELKTFPSDRQLLSARFSPCGAVLASGAMDRVVMRWSVVEKKKTEEVALPDDSAKKPAPKNAKNAKPESPVELVPLPPLGGFNGWVQSIAFHPTDKLLFVSDSWGKLACTPYEGDAPKPHWENAAAHTAAIRRIAVSTDGKLIATCGADQFVRVWNSADGKPVAKHEHTSDVFALTFTPDGTQIVFGDLFAKISVLDFKADKIVRQFEAAPFYTLSRMQDVAGLRTLMFLDGGRTLLAAGCNPEGGGFVQGIPVLMEFDFTTGKQSREVRLGTTKEGFVHDVVRIRLADGAPISLEHARFPAGRFPDLLEQSLGGSIYELLARRYGVDPAEAEERIEVIEASHDEAAVLGTATGSALLSITRTTRDDGGVPIEFSHDLFRADRTVITVRTRGNQGTAGTARARGRRIELRARSS